jgi:hypothetical protein
MDWVSPKLWLPIMFVGFALLTVLVIHAQRMRQVEWRQAALPIGFMPFTGNLPFEGSARKSFRLFNRGFTGNKWQNVYSNDVANPSAFLFDFTYTFGIPFVRSKVYRQTVAAFLVGSVNLPDFQLAPFDILDRLAPKMGFQAIEFGSHPEFNRRYWLRSSREAAVRTIFTHRFLDLLTSYRETAWSVEKAGQWMVFYQQNAIIHGDFMAKFWFSCCELISTMSNRLPLHGNEFEDSASGYRNAR